MGRNDVGDRHLYAVPGGGGWDGSVCTGALGVVRGGGVQSPAEATGGPATATGPGRAAGLAATRGAGSGDARLALRRPGGRVRLTDTHGDRLLAAVLRAPAVGDRRPAQPHPPSRAGRTR